VNIHTLRKLAKPLPNAPELQELDRLTRLALQDGCSWQLVEEAFEAVLNHPQNTFTRESLAYRQNYVHHSDDASRH
jgi:hypothetical protein